MLFSALNIGVLHLKASPSSVFNTAVLWGSTAEEWEMLPSELPELLASIMLLKLWLSSYYREWTQIVTITSVWKHCNKRRLLSLYRYAVPPLCQESLSMFLWELLQPSTSVLVWLVSSGCFEPDGEKDEQVLTDSWKRISEKKKSVLFFLGKWIPL